MATATVPSRRAFLGGLIAACAAPAIIRPGLLMPIKPSLVPGYRLVQMGVDVQLPWFEAELPISEFEARILRPAMLALARQVEMNGYMPHNERPAFAPEMLNPRYVGELRAVDWYDEAADRKLRRYDGFWRDYHVDRDYVVGGFGARERPDVG